MAIDPRSESKTTAGHQCVSTGLTWILFDDGNSRLPKWKRLVAKSKSGKIFVPADMGDDEEKVLLLAFHDGIPAVIFGGHAYLPIEWLAETYPDLREHREILSRRLELS